MIFALNSLYYSCPGLMSFRRCENIPHERTYVYICRDSRLVIRSSSKCLDSHLVGRVSLCCLIDAEDESDLFRRYSAEPLSYYVVPGGVQFCCRHVHTSSIGLSSFVGREIQVRMGCNHQNDMHVFSLRQLKLEIWFPENSAG